MTQECNHSRLAIDAINAIVFPLFIADPKNYSIKYANSIAQHLGFRVNKKCYEYGPGNKKACLATNRYCPIDIVKKIKKPVEVELSNRTKVGEKIYKVYGEPIFNGSKIVSNVVLYSMDITKYRQEQRAFHIIRDILKFERKLLKSKSITLKEVLYQIESETKRLFGKIQSNLERVTEPLLLSLEQRVSPKEKEYVQLLRNSLSDISSPFISDPENRLAGLTPREMDICLRIKNGMSSKEIAAVLDISAQTVDKQRANIRRKLELIGKDINLASYLQKLSN